MKKIYQPDEFPKLIRESRERAGLSQHAAARAVTPEVPHSTWWAYEHGTKNPSFAMASKLAAAVGVTLTINATS